MKFTGIILLFFTLFSCSRQEDSPSAKKKDPAANEHITSPEVPKPLDSAMTEVAKSYHALYQEGIQKNWNAAAIQLQKIKQGVAYGTEPGSHRALSARPFLDEAIPRMEKTIALKNSKKFIENFKQFTAACNGCHASENVPFFPVVMPGDSKQD